MAAIPSADMATSVSPGLQHPPPAANDTVGDVTQAMQHASLTECGAPAPLRPSLVRDGTPRRPGSSRTVSFATTSEIRPISPMSDTQDYYRSTGEAEFTSDGHVTRCVETAGIDAQDVIAVLSTMRPGRVVAHTVFPDGGALIYLDGSDIAERLLDTIRHSYPNAGCTFVQPASIAHVLNYLQRPLALSTFNGQLMLTATWADQQLRVDFDQMFDTSIRMVNAYGRPRRFAEISRGQNQAEFRVEMFKLSDVRNILESAGIDRQHVLTPNVKITVHYFDGTGPRLDPPLDSASIRIDQIYNHRAFRLRYTGLNHNGGGEVPQPTYGMNISTNARTGSIRPNNEFGAQQGRRRFQESTNTAHTGQTVLIENIENGSDVRTTLMLRNLPKHLTFSDVRDVLYRTSYGRIDFLYVRVDFGTSENVGYGFVNFVYPEYMIAFLQACVGRPWPGFESQRALEVSYATIQGQECLIQKFRNSSVLDREYEFTPKILYTIHDEDIPPGKRIGDDYPFPVPDNLQKRQRSQENANSIGLFTHRQARNVRGNRRPRSQYDRGTPRAGRDDGITRQTGTIERGMLQGAFTPDRTHGRDARHDFGTLDSSRLWVTHTDRDLLPRMQPRMRTGLPAPNVGGVARLNPSTPAFVPDAMAAFRQSQRGMPPSPPPEGDASYTWH